MKWLSPAWRSASAFVAELWREDRATAWVASLHALAALLVAGWDLPGTFGWECDGIAPRDLFRTVGANLTPGSGHNYPLFHGLLLLLLSLPFLLAGLGRWLLVGGSIRDAMLTPLTMTGISVVAKLTAIAMSTLTLLLLARLARRLFGVRAGYLTTLFAATMLAFAYYSRTSNLDVPYLFWTVLAVERYVAALPDRRGYAPAAACAALALATKDQAYASFVLVALVYAVLLPLVTRGFVADRRTHFRNLARAALTFVVVYGVASPALLNPTGFVYRLRLLSGQNSQEWRNYEPTLAGKLENLRDLVRLAPEHLWPWPVFGLVLVGLVLSVRRRPLGFLPACAAVSSVLLFTLVAARREARFVLPAGLWLSVYAGAGAAIALSAIERGLSPGPLRRAVSLLLVSALALPGALRVTALAFTQWRDARRGLEAWLSELPRGTRVETYGKLVYQPHFDVSSSAPYRVTRIDTARGAKRNPMPGVSELDPPFSGIEKRAPDVLILQEAWIRRFTEPDRAAARVRQKDLANEDAVGFFRKATSGGIPGYRSSRAFESELPGWLSALGQSPIKLHGSTGERVFVVERER